MSLSGLLRSQILIRSSRISAALSSFIATSTPPAFAIDAAAKSNFKSNFAAGVFGDDVAAGIEIAGAMAIFEAERE